MSLSKYLKNSFSWRKVPRIILIFIISMIVFSGLNNSSQSHIEPYLNQISLSFDFFVVFLTLYVAYALWYIPRWSYTHGNKNNIYISIPYEFRSYYKDRVYMSYEPKKGLKIISEAHYTALMNKLDELNLEPNNKIQGFIEGGMTELNVRNHIIKVPKEWRRKLSGKGINISITKDEILVGTVHNSTSVYTGKELGDGGAWVSLKK